MTLKNPNQGLIEEYRNKTCQRLALEAIIEERQFQRGRWTDEHDRRHTLLEWITILQVYLGKAGQETPIYQGPGFVMHRFKRRIVQLGAICLAMLEAMEEGTANGGTDTQT